MGKKKEKQPEDKEQTFVTDTYMEEEGGFMNLGEPLGKVEISNEVVVTIASIAASKVQGVHSTGGKSFFGKKDLERGISASVEENRTAFIDVEVKIDYGKNIYDTVQKLQKNIKDAVEQMTGLEVERVNVTVKSVIVPESVEFPPVEPEEDK